MTVSATAVRSRPASGRRRAGSPRLRIAVLALHTMVGSLAIASLFTNGYSLWSDLRQLGAMAVFLELLWTACSLVAIFCAGPWIVPWPRPRWVQQGYAPTWANRLLWPSYLLMACLLTNTVYYLQLYRQGLADPQVPLPLVVMLILSGWVLLTREWLRRSAALPASAPLPRGRMVMIVLAGAITLTVATACGLVHRYAHRPAKPVDLAVVLGGRVEADGRASVELADRARAAVDLYRRGQVRHILLSGAIFPPAAPGKPERSEVAAMKQVCLDEGVPDEALSLDPVGVNTRATAFNTRIFMQQYGFRTVVACSTDFHLFRTAMAFRECGIEASTLPARPSAWQCANPRNTLRELLAIATYQLNPHYRQPKAQTMHLTSPRLIVSKSSGALKLYDGDALVKTYSCITGGNAGDKAVEGDRKTPEGSFHIVFKNPQSKFHLSLGLDYPNREDAQRGLASGLITRRQYEDILAALASDLTREENQKKLWYTPLGGEIFLHGHAEGRTGTAGCVALSNPDIEELYAVLPLGTPVEVKP
jgi:vancomycin permeability regulator SanA